ncbi:MAG: guanylate kinase [Gammaproteobacteria bacterium]|nr:guanylate kinase [Gammaproteobacteria bacterium]
MARNARLFVIAAPSGAGKTTLVKALVERNPALKFSVSYTTRRKRKNEVDSRDYFFVTQEEFARLKEQGELLESALVFDNHCGTSRSQVEAHLASGNHVILEIDWQGARQVRESMPGCTSVFILPPSRTELERRLRGRRTDSEKVIARRLADALGDMSHWEEFDYVIINDDLDAAVLDLEGVIAENSGECRVNNPSLRRRIENILA